jgi:hypothetical protein
MVEKIANHLKNTKSMIEKQTKSMIHKLPNLWFKNIPNQLLKKYPSKDLNKYPINDWKTYQINERNFVGRFSVHLLVEEPVEVEPDQQVQDQPHVYQPNHLGLGGMQGSQFYK